MATLQNVTIDSTSHVQLPTGTTAQRPGSPETGQSRWNTSLNVLEIYNGTYWDYQPSFTRDGLVLYLDAAEPSSYPGSGTTWTDLSGQGNHGTLTNGPTFVSGTAGGVIQFDGSDDKIDTNGPNLSTSNYTVVCGTRYSGATRGRIVSAKSNNFLLGHWSNQAKKFYSGGWVSSSGGGPSDTEWRIYAGVGSYTGDTYSYYINGLRHAGPNTSGSLGPNAFGLGRYALGNSGSGSEFSTGQISFLLAYNRSLSSHEIQVIFRAFRGRFSI